MTTTIVEDDLVTEFSGASRTLWLPLLARVKENQQPNPLLVDRRAAQIVADLQDCGQFQTDFQDMDRVADRFLQLSQLIRAKCIDDEVRLFLARFPRATIVNIGAGLDTTFDRVDNGQLTWYDLDFPEVIAIRRRYIPETLRNRYIASSVLDLSWCDQIGDGSHGLLFIACGVLFFLEEGQAKGLFQALVGRFPGSEIVFDGMSRVFMGIANRTVLRRTAMGSQAAMRWATPSARKIAGWDRRIDVVDEYPLFSRIHLDPCWGMKSIIRMKVVNWMKGMNVCHLMFGSLTTRM
ncbi:MAG TPA: class I SAM-dependent methyltransferase [Anaerolineaceae bacterium]|nr:class I SAM-dependent methyltransferase [Anaerolineaceae bacterium]